MRCIANNWRQADLSRDNVALTNSLIFPRAAYALLFYQTVQVSPENDLVSGKKFGDDFAKHWPVLDERACSLTQRNEIPASGQQLYIPIESGAEWLNRNYSPGASTARQPTQDWFYQANFSTCSNNVRCQKNHSRPVFFRNL